MKGFVSTLLFVTIICCCSTESYAIVAPAPETVADAQQQRLQKRMRAFKIKLEKKLFKKYKQAAPPQIWENDRFRLGVIAFGIGLVLALVAGVGIASGFFSFLALLAILAGLVLVVWALVDYNS